MLASEYEQAQKELNTELEDPIENGETQTKDLNPLLVNVRKYADTQELAAQMVNDLVNKIIVHAPTRAVDIGNKRLKITTTLSASLICLLLKRTIVSPLTAYAKIKR
jgi:hypothetical protein